MYILVGRHPGSTGHHIYGAKSVLRFLQNEKLANDISGE